MVENEGERVMRKRVMALVWGILLVLMTACETFAAAVPQEDTPEYKIGFMRLTAIICRMRTGDVPVTVMR